MAATTTNNNSDLSSIHNHTRERMSVSASSSTPSLPSFVELMASLGLHDEHSANALIRGASLPTDEKPAPFGPANDNQQELSSVQPSDESPIGASQQQQVEPRASNYRDSTVSITSLGLATPSLESQNPLSLGTPLSSAPLLTPLNSPNAHRDRPNASAHGKKRYSPYGLSPPNMNEYRDIYSRRGSVPGTTTEIDDALKEQRQIHHRSAPPINHLQFSQIESAPRLQRRTTDEDGDEEMKDADDANESISPSSYIAKEKETHCAGQPNVLFSRQRISRGTLGARTKSQTNLRGTSINQTPFPSHKQGAPSISSRNEGGHSTSVKDKSPYSSLGRRSARDIVNANAIQNPSTTIIDLGMDNDVDVDNNAPVASISSLMRRSHPVTSSTANANVTATAGGVATIPEASEASSSSNAGSAVRSHHLSLHNRSRGTLSTPPSAPPTKTTFGFTPGVSISGTSISAARRARHARSSSARSVQEMMREQKNPIMFQSFHPLAEDVPPVPPMPSLQTVPSISNISSISKQVSKKRISGNNSDNSDPGRTLGSDSFLPLDDTSRSFAHRRRARRQHLKNSPPPPLMLLPTLPNTFSIKSIIGVPPGSTGDGKDGENGDGMKKAAMLGPGYVSRREPHSPDARSSWRTRRTTPPSSSLAAPSVGVMES